MPCVLGYEVAGVVSAVGPEVEGLTIGDRVMAMTPFPAGGGGYAELVVVPADHAVRLDPVVDFAEAAVSPVAGGTALEVLDRLGLPPGSTLLVLAASGGVGSFLIPLAAHRGLRVIAVGSAATHDRMTASGAWACVDYRAEAVAARAVDLAGGPVDGIADLVGGTALAAALPALRDGGAIASIETPELDLEPLLDRNLTLHGVLIGNSRKRLAPVGRACSRKGWSGRTSLIVCRWLTQPGPIGCWTRATAEARSSSSQATPDLLDPLFVACVAESQVRWATVSRMADASTASRLCRDLGIVSRSPGEPFQKSSPATSRIRPCSTCTVASPGLSCSLIDEPAVSAISVCRSECS